MKIRREIVTPYLALIFMVVAISGILMFFHLLDGYTAVVHEFLGVAFALFAIMHILNNWKSITNYSKKRQLTIPAMIILVISTAFIIGGKLKGNIENDVITRLLKAPVSASFSALNIDYREAEKTLNQHHIMISDSLESIETISVKNKRDPEEIMELLLKK